MSYRPPEPLSAAHHVDRFRCGEPALDQWLARYAITSQATGAARTFVSLDAHDAVVGFYALAAAQVEPVTSTQRLAKGQPAQRPIPVVLLARLAVHVDHQGRHLGRSLLQDAVHRTLGAADSIGVRALLVHAKDRDAAAWYAQFGFEASPTDPLHLVLLLKDARRIIG